MDDRIKAVRKIENETLTKSPCHVLNYIHRVANDKDFYCLCMSRSTDELEYISILIASTYA